VLCWAQHNADYIQLCHGDSQAPTTQSEVIQRTAAVIPRGYQSRGGGRPAKKPAYAGWIGNKLRF